MIKVVAKHFMKVDRIHEFLNVPMNSLKQA